jgi:hypothetical protein
MRTRLMAMALVAALPGPLSASSYHPTIRMLAVQSDLILFGSIVEARLVKEDRFFPIGTTDFAIHTVLRDHPALKDSKRIILPDYLDPTRKSTSRYLLVFCKVLKGRITLCRYETFRDLVQLPYLKGVAGLDPNDAAGNNAFFIRHMMSRDPFIARDAVCEVAGAGDVGLVNAAPKLDPVELRAWLRTPRLESYGRRSRAALLLGLKRRPADVAFVRALLAREDDRNCPGLMAAYTLLSPKEGLAYITGQLKSKDDRAAPWRAFRAVELLHECQAGALREKDVAALACLALEKINDYEAYEVVEKLRRWKCWGAARCVVALTKREGYVKERSLREAVIRYCLRCKGRPEADEYLADERVWHHRMVKSIEDRLADRERREEGDER